MFGHGCRTHATNESGIGVQRNSGLLSILIKTAKLDSLNSNETTSGLHLHITDMFHLQWLITNTGRPSM